MTDRRGFQNGRCTRGHDITDPANVEHNSSGGRQCKLCRRDYDRNRKRATTHVFVDGKCSRGHDITLPDAVRVTDRGRQCIICQKEMKRRRYAFCMTCSKPKARNADRFCSKECRVDAQARGAANVNEAQMSPGQVAYRLDLLQKAEGAPHWERERILRQLNASKLLKERSLARRVARGDGGADAIRRDLEHVRQERHRAAVGARNDAVPQVVERLGREPAALRQGLQRLAGGRDVQ